MYQRHSHIDDESLDLGRYIGSHDQDNHRFGQQAPVHKNLHSQELHMQINRINSKLEPLGPERLGDLTSNSIKQIEKTLQLVETLMSEIKKLQQSKAKLTNERRQTEQTLMQNQQTIDKLNRDKKSIENERQTILQKYKNLQKVFKETNDRNQSEKEDLNKQIKQLQARQKTFEAEFRKKQQQIKTLQDGLRKFQDKPQFKNSFDVIQKLEYGPNIYDTCSTNGENQYGRLAKDSRDEVFRKLSDQNAHLKQCLVNIYKQLNTVLELKKQTLRNKKGYDGQYQNYFQLNSFRPETLNLPQQWSRQRLKQLNENIQKFKQAIRIGDHSDSRVDQRKQGCVNGIKQLIKNYKQVVETQDQLLNKVLLKSKQFKATEMAHLQNRFSKVMDNNELERAKRFVDEQAQYLESKNLELEKTRKMMQAAMKRAEESKKQMVRQRQAFEEEALEMRRSVEVLPAIIEEELAKALN